MLIKTEKSIEELEKKLQVGKNERAKTHIHTTKINKFIKNLYSIQSLHSIHAKSIIRKLVDEIVMTPVYDDESYLKAEIKIRSESITPLFDNKFLLMVGGAWFLQFSNKIDIRISQ